MKGITGKKLVLLVDEVVYKIVYQDRDFALIHLLFPTSA